jgi:hypothetical protein
MLGSALKLIATTSIYIQIHGQQINQLSSAMILYLSSYFYEHYIIYMFIYIIYVHKTAHDY